jgi:hypothetical protein
MKNPAGRDNNDSKKGKKEKKRGAPKDDDDLDDFGNVEGLIDYEYDSEDDDESEVSMTKSELRALKKYGRLPSTLKDEIGGRSPRKAALKAREQIRKKLKKEDRRNNSPTTSDSTYVS